MKLSLLIGQAILVWAAHGQSSTIGSLFCQTDACLTYWCAFHSIGYVDSQLHCTTLCSMDQNCVGYEYHTNTGDCYKLFGGCFLQLSCSHDGVLLARRELDCFNEGVWNETKQACVCVGGWVGTTCERLGNSCKDLYHNGYQTGAYSVHLDVYQNGSKFVATHCEIENNQFRTFIMRSKGVGGFNKTYQEYIDGFSNGNDLIWLGLENILAFNRMGHDLFGISLILEATDGVYSWWHQYQDFELGGSSQGYVILNPGLLSSGGNASLYTGYFMRNILRPFALLYRPFSAWDNDQDNTNYNCAAESGAGWWFSNFCTNLNIMNSVNPMGLNPQTTSETGLEKTLWIPGVNFSDYSIYSTFSAIQMYYITYP